MKELTIDEEILVSGGGDVSAFGRSVVISCTGEPDDGSAHVSASPGGEFGCGPDGEDL